ncbi:MAG: hypothetical protein IMZ61_10140, partial [Planctomycetes bacterium]|nr:hypothetical protein [Planctomycetota bacterium]
MGAYAHNPSCITPAMTANNAPAPFVASASGEYSGYSAWNAFAQDPANHWWYSGAIGAPLTLAVFLGSGQGRRITSYTLTSIFNCASYISMPTDWILQGSADRGLTWADIDIRADIPAFGNLEMRTYTLSVRSAAYEDFRLYITGTTGSSTYQIGALELIDDYAAELPDIGDTLQIGEEEYVFVASRSNAHEITIGETEEDTATNIATALNADSALVSASASATSVTVTAKETGAGGNEIVFAEDAANISMD